MLTTALFVSMLTVLFASTRVRGTIEKTCRDVDCGDSAFCASWPGRPECFPCEGSCSRSRLGTYRESRGRKKCYEICPVYTSNVYGPQDLEVIGSGEEHASTEKASLQTLPPRERYFPPCSSERNDRNEHIFGHTVTEFVLMVGMVSSVVLSLISMFIFVWHVHAYKRGSCRF